MRKLSDPVFMLLATLLGATVFTLLWRWNPYTLGVVWLLLLSGVNITLYGYDKWQARRHGYRVPELVLHCVSLAGGFAGGWLGMVIFNHKHRKTSFWLVLSASTVLYLCLIFFNFPGRNG